MEDGGDLAPLSLNSITILSNKSAALTPNPLCIKWIIDAMKKGGEKG
jgi:hypothetical protein